MLLTSVLYLLCALISFFFFNDTATTEIYTLSLHDALPISRSARDECRAGSTTPTAARGDPGHRRQTARRYRCGSDRKSTRLNSSHLVISYAVFCLKKKKKKLNSVYLAVTLIELMNRHQRDA